MNPRPYQEKCISAVLEAFNTFQKVLAVLPTGAGKTLLFSWLAQWFLKQGKRTLILAHREELIDQAIAKLRSATGITAQKEMAEYESSPDAQVVVGSIQSIGNRLWKWQPDHFGLVVCDEAHHAISPSWQKVLGHFDAAKVLGVTATPDRGDKKNLGQFFETIAFEIGLFDLIRDGYLSKITLQTVPLQIDLNAVSSKMGDFAEKDLDSAIRPYLGQIAREIKALAPFRRTLAFLPLIDTSKEFVEHCNSLPNCKGWARHVDGYCDDRKAILDDFAAGRFDLLSNAMLLTEGYDCPTVDCVVVLRPTRSRPLYSQMIGRGTRTADCKSNLLLLDFLWMHEKHSLVRPAHLVAGSEDEAREILDLSLAHDDSKQNQGGQEELDLETLATDARAAREERLRKELEEHKSKKGKFISAEEFAVQNHAMDIAEFEPTMKWESEPVTEAQAKYLKKAHIDIDTVRGKGHATKILSLHFSHQNLLPASDKTKQMMRRMGNPNADIATRSDEKKFWAELRKKKA